MSPAESKLWKHYALIRWVMCISEINTPLKNSLSIFPHRTPDGVLRQKLIIELDEVSIEQEYDENERRKW
jgi:hypothetical protein